MSFRQSLASGQYGEVALAKCLRRAGFACITNDTIDYDLKVTAAMPPASDLSFTVEVKFDQMEAKTGNIAVEYYNTKLCKPSGIAATNADLWAIVLQDPHSIWLARVDELRKFLDRVKPHREVVNAGDDNAALKLYCRDVILPAVFTQIDLLGPEALVELLHEFIPCTTSK